jgi:hypothetical protein
MKLESLFVTLVIAALWVALFDFNHYVFKFTEVTAITSLIFIPSGYKVAVVCVFGGRSWLGLFLGSLITGFLFLSHFSYVDIFIFSVLSATLPFVALKLSGYVYPLNPKLSNLTVKHIILIGLIFATLNGCFHITYRYHGLFLRNGNEIHEILSMMVGDLLGILITILIVARLSRLKIARNFLNK